VPVVTAVTAGLVAHQIVAYARRNTIDLIVIATHGRTGVSRMLLGSVAEAVVRHAPCRVLIVPPALEAASVEGAVAEAAPTETTSCVVCGGPTQGELICETCRAKIRGEALERKLKDERTGR